MVDMQQRLGGDYGDKELSFVKSDKQGDVELDLGYLLGRWEQWGKGIVGLVGWVIDRWRQVGEGKKLSYMGKEGLERGYARGPGWIRREDETVI